MTKKSKEITLLIHPDIDSKLVSLILDLRKIFVNKFLPKIKANNTTGQCFYGALFVEKLLTRYYDKSKKMEINGGGYGDGGYLVLVNVRRSIESHYWLMIDNDIIVDITADQFGGPEVFIQYKKYAKNYRFPKKLESIDYTRKIVQLYMDKIREIYPEI